MASGGEVCVVDHSYEVIKIHALSDLQRQVAAVTVDGSNATPEPYITPAASSVTPGTEVESPHKKSHVYSQVDYDGEFEGESSQPQQAASAAAPSSANEPPGYERIDLSVVGNDVNQGGITSQVPSEYYTALGTVGPSSTYTEVQQGSRFKLKLPKLKRTRHSQISAAAPAIDEDTARASNDDDGGRETVTTQEATPAPDSADSAAAVSDSAEAQGPRRRCVSWLGELRRVDYIFGVVIILSVVFALVAFIVSLATIPSSSGGLSTQVSNLEQVVARLPDFTRCSTVERSCTLSLPSETMLNVTRCTTDAAPVDVTGVYMKEIKCAVRGLGHQLTNDSILTSTLVLDFDQRTSLQTAKCLCSEILATAATNGSQCILVATSCPL